MSAADWNAKRRAKRLAECRHFTGIQNETCKAGIRYADARDPSTRPFGFPCLDGPCAKPCPKKETRTQAEIDAEEAEWGRRFTAVIEARAAALATKQRTGTVNCPMCKAPGAVRFSVSSYNGHVHGHCSTEGCLSWME